MTKSDKECAYDINFDVKCGGCIFFILTYNSSKDPVSLGKYDYKRRIYHEFFPIVDVCFFFVELFNHAGGVSTIISRLIFPRFISDMNTH